MNKEKWVAALGFEGIYEISSYGGIKRLPRKSRNSRNKNTFKQYKERITYPKSSNGRYTSLKLSVDGKIFHMDLHRLMMLSFYKKPFKDAHVNHKDGVKTNNVLDNLEWVTCSENLKHARMIGLVNPAKGEDSGKSKVTNNDVLNIRKYRNAGKTYKEISIITGQSVKLIGDILRGRTWKHL